MLYVSVKGSRLTLLNFSISVARNRRVDVIGSVVHNGQAYGAYDGQANAHWVNGRSTIIERYTTKAR